MKVYVVIRNDYYKYEFDYDEIVGIFFDSKKADEYIVHCEKVPMKSWGSASFHVESHEVQ